MERVSQMKKKIYFFNIYSSQATTHDYIVCMPISQLQALLQILQAALMWRII